MDETDESVSGIYDYDESVSGNYGEDPYEYVPEAYDYDAETNAALGNYLSTNFPELSTDPSLATQLGGVLQKVGADAFNSLKNTFMTKDGKVDWRSVAGAAGGLYGLYQANKPQEKVGYQGKIPEYTAVRERVPMTYDPTRRPGSSGQQYFTAPSFAKKGDTTAIDAARSTALEQATALASANATNPARQTLPAATAVTSPAGGGTAAVMPRAASSVIQDLKVPVYTEENARGMQYAAGGLTGLYGADVESLYSDNVNRKKEDYAAGGIAGMAKGRYLGGATDGMADKIPARIGGKQEARLSHGEFVIPADVVSHLGNGNSEAGAKRLYAMMDKIRTARTGTKKQGKQINPDKFLA